MVLASPRVSICIPTHALTYQMMYTFKVLAFDAELADSVEIIVVYDGTPVNDWGTETAIVQGLNLKQTSMAKAGPATARNLAASMASAERLIFCDSDVIITRDAVRAAARVEAGQLMVPRIDPIAQDNQIATFFSEYVFAPKHEKGYDYVVSAFWGMLKSDFDYLGGFDERFRYPAGEDFDFMKRWNDSGRTVNYVSDAVVFHRNPTTLAELLDRAHRYGRHGNLEPQATPAGEGRPPVVAIAPATWLDLVLYPLIVITGGAGKRFKAAEQRLVAASLAARNRAQVRGGSWLALPAWLYKSLRTLAKVVGFSLALITGGRGYPVHNNRKLTVLWLVAWQIGRVKGAAATKFGRHLKRHAADDSR